MSEGAGAFYANTTRRNDGGSGTYPRYSLVYTERAASPLNTPTDEDAIWGFFSATAYDSTDAKFIAGVLNGALPSDEWTVGLSNLSAGMLIQTDRVTVTPALLFDPQASAPATVSGNLYFDSGSGELKLYSGGWQTLTTGSGMTAHDLTGAYHTEDATGGAGNFLKADSGTTFSWQAHGLTNTDVGAAATIHNLIDNTNHPVSGLTPGNFLKALTATTYGFAAHGLGASDVGAYTTAQVDSAIDTDITTHAGLATVHQDAPALISTHASDDDAHHALVTVTALPLTLSGQAVTFNYDTNYFQLNGNDLRIGTDVPSTDQVLTWSGSVAVWSDPTGGVPVALTDLDSYAQGSIIIGGGVDWEALIAGTQNHVLKMGVAEPAWGQVDWSELSGSQPAPIAHVLATTGPHTGTLPWNDLDKTGSSLADLATRTHASLSDAPTDAHHSEAHILGTATGPHSAALPLSDLDAWSQGAIIYGGMSDWLTMALGTAGWVLKAGSALPIWGQINYSELTGTQPAPVAHNLVDTTGHPVSGLTPGHYLKALTATTYGFAAAAAGTPYQPIVEKDAIIWRPDLTTWANGECPDFCTAAPGNFELIDADNYLRVSTSVYYTSGYDSSSLRAHHNSVDDDKPAHRIYLPFISMPAFEIRFRWRRAQISIRGHKWAFYAWFWDGTSSAFTYKKLFELEHLSGGILECQTESGETANDTLSYSADTWYDLRFQVVGQKGAAAANEGQIRSSMIASSGSTWQTSWSSWYAFISTDGTDAHALVGPAFITVQMNNASYACDTYIDDLEILYCDVTL
jgi:hypothetical protein